MSEKTPDPSRGGEGPHAARFESARAGVEVVGSDQGGRMWALLAACHVRVPEMKLDPPTSVPIPAGLWTTRPVPFDYDEVGWVYSEEWTLNRGFVGLLAAAREDLGSSDVVDVGFTSEWREVPGEQCDQLTRCRRDPYSGKVEALVWSLHGLAVDRIATPEAH